MGRAARWLAEGANANVAAAVLTSSQVIRGWPRWSNYTATKFRLNRSLFRRQATDSDDRLPMEPQGGLLKMFLHVFLD